MSFVRQHLIDPISCVRCDSCRFACPAQAINKIDGTLVIDFYSCDGSESCLAVCDTGAILASRIVASESVYTMAEQAAWAELPKQIEAEGMDEAEVAASAAAVGPRAPASALEPQVNKFRDSAPALARVVSNEFITADSSSWIHHIVLDLKGSGMVAAEGQSIGVLSPGVDANGVAHAARLYSVASASGGEGGHEGHVAFTVKRVLEDASGNYHPGIASNFLCSRRPGESVHLTGPYGNSFLFPEDRAARLLMICTGTGIAPMRGMLERRRVERNLGAKALTLLYGGRTLGDLPYHRELSESALKGEIHLAVALSRESDAPRKYVQDLVRDYSALVLDHLNDPNSVVYMCGLVDMEHGVLAAFADICAAAGQDWAALHNKMQEEGRFHAESY